MSAAMIEMTAQKNISIQQSALDKLAQSASGMCIVTWDTSQKNKSYFLVILSSNVTIQHTLLLSHVKISHTTTLPKKDTGLDLYLFVATVGKIFWEVTVTLIYKGIMWSKLCSFKSIQRSHNLNIHAGPCSCELPVNSTIWLWVLIYSYPETVLDAQHLIPLHCSWYQPHCQSQWFALVQGIAALGHVTLLGQANPQVCMFAIDSLPSNAATHTCTGFNTIATTLGYDVLSEKLRMPWPVLAQVMVTLKSTLVTTQHA